MDPCAVSIRNGFSLIELLVVIAIISLLVSILLPSLNRAKDLARTVVCATNQRTIVLGAAMYRAERGGFPPCYDRNIVTPAGYPSVVWPQLLYWTGEVDRLAYDDSYRYLPAPLYSIGPADEVSGIYCPGSELVDYRGWRHHNYAYSRVMCPPPDFYLGQNSDYAYQKTSLQPEDDENPSTLMILGDAGSFVNSAGNASIHSDCRPRDGWIGHYEQWSQLSGPHPNDTLNACFTDGHVEVLYHTAAEAYYKWYLRWMNRSQTN